MNTPTKNPIMNALTISLLAVLIGFLPISSIDGQEISVKPGFWNVKYYQDDRLIDKRDVESIMKSNEESSIAWKKSKSMRTASWIALGVNAGFLTWIIVGNNNNKKASYTNDKKTYLAVPVVGYIFTTFVYLGFRASTKRLKGKAIMLYNEGLDSDSYIKMNVTPNEAGIVIVF